MPAQSRITRFQSFVAYTQVGIDLKFSTLQSNLKHGALLTRSYHVTHYISFTLINVTALVNA